MEKIETTAKLTINDIEQITELEAAEMAEEKIVIKGDYNCYFIDFGGYFGYSVCVFADGQHIYYANDYQSHHGSKPRRELREWYIETLNNKLYTVEELNTVTDYDDYTHKAYFIRNYYSLRRPHISIFGIFRAKEDEEAHSCKIAGKMYSPVSFAYYDDAEFVKTLTNLLNKLNKAKERNNNSLEYWENAFYYEMCNHEYGINWQGDYDVISCFAHVPYSENTADILNAAHFSDVQLRAYKNARRKYYKAAEENEWF